MKVTTTTVIEFETRESVQVTVLPRSELRWIFRIVDTLDGTLPKLRGLNISGNTVPVKWEHLDRASRERIEGIIADNIGVTR